MSLPWIRLQSPRWSLRKDSVFLYRVFHSGMSIVNNSILSLLCCKSRPVLLPSLYGVGCVNFRSLLCAVFLWKRLDFSKHRRKEKKYLKYSRQGRIYDSRSSFRRSAAACFSLFLVFSTFALGLGCHFYREGEVFARVGLRGVETFYHSRRRTRVWQLHPIILCNYNYTALCDDWQNNGGGCRFRVSSIQQRTLGPSVIFLIFVFATPQS